MRSNFFGKCTKCETETSPRILIFCMIFEEKYFSNYVILGDSRNYVPPIFVPSSAKGIATQIFSICKTKWKKRFCFESFCL